MEDFSFSIQKQILKMLFLSLEEYWINLLYTKRKIKKQARINALLELPIQDLRTGRFFNMNVYEDFIAENAKRIWGDGWEDKLRHEREIRHMNATYGNY